MLLNTINRFSDYFSLQNQTPGFHIPYENSFTPAFILHSEFNLHRTKRSLNTTTPLEPNSRGKNPILIT